MVQQDFDYLFFDSFGRQESFPIFFSFFFFLLQMAGLIRPVDGLSVYI